MFNAKKIARLEREVAELRNNLSELRANNSPLHFGPFPRSYIGMYLISVNDPRPTISHAEAIQLLLDHCNVEFTKIPGTPDKIVLERRKK